MSRTITHRCLSLLVTLGALSGCAASDPDPEDVQVQSDAVVSSIAAGEYVIHSVANNKCVDIAGGSTADGAKVQLWDCNGTNAQKFTVAPTSDGYWKIINVNSGKGLDIKDVSTAANAEVQQWSYGGGNNQQFKIVDRGNGQLSLHARHTDMAIDLLWGRADNGTGFVQSPYTGASNQLYTFESAMTHIGEGTFYATVDDGGSCSFGHGSSDLFGAMNQTDYAGSAACGMCAQITGPSGAVKVKITNVCPGCKPGDIDLSEQAFTKLAPKQEGRIPISWKYVPCDVQGGIVYHFKEGSNEWWNAVQIRNAKTGIAKLEATNQDGAFVALPRQSYNYFLASSGLGKGPFTFRVTDVNGNVITESGIAFAPNNDVPSPGNKQFP